ncbi:hypothetical protein RESH_04732 [Rhodopirellula europaea SH398]|uniref:Uncharacterized protein n=1 Tax=Rhodopirellula europaea SH398 TaxID=1263868 RepID=M5RZF2_9BACT|nr:hypothetical protein RESH_04732 [Rhodopirellula europaea SH398]
MFGFEIDGMSSLQSSRGTSPGTREKFLISKQADSRTRVHAIVPRTFQRPKKAESSATAVRKLYRGQVGFTKLRFASKCVITNIAA